MSASKSKVLSAHEIQNWFQMKGQGEGKRDPPVAASASTAVEQKRPAPVVPTLTNTKEYIGNVLREHVHDKTLYTVEELSKPVTTLDYVFPGVALFPSKILDTSKVAKSAAEFNKRFCTRVPELANFSLGAFSMVVAGGAASGILVDGEFQDIDLFFIDNPTVDDVEKRIQQLEKHLLDYCQGRPFSVYRTHNCVTFVPTSSSCDSKRVTVLPHTIQVVLRGYSSIRQVIHDFDLGSCAVAYAHMANLVTDVFLSRTALFAFTYGLNIVHCPDMHWNSDNRLGKYFARGFGIVFPDFQWPAETDVKSIVTALKDDFARVSITAQPVSIDPKCRTCKGTITARGLVETDTISTYDPVQYVSDYQKLGDIPLTHHNMKMALLAHHGRKPFLVAKEASFSRNMAAFYDVKEIVHQLESHAKPTAFNKPALAKLFLPHVVQQLAQWIVMEDKTLTHETFEVMAKAYVQLVHARFASQFPFDLKTDHMIASKALDASARDKVWIEKTRTWYGKAFASGQETVSVSVPSPTGSIPVPASMTAPVTGTKHSCSGSNCSVCDQEMRTVAKPMTDDKPVVTTLASTHRQRRPSADDWINVGL